MAARALAVVLCLWIATQASAAAANKSRAIYILCLLPYPDTLFNPSWREGPAVSLALDMARDQINNQTELLPDYRVELIHDDSGCEYTTRAYVAFMRNAYSGATRNKLTGIIGPGCSSASLAVSPLSSNKEVAIVTLHGGGSPLLSSRTNYRYALSSLGVSESFAHIGIKLMHKSEWNRIGVLFDESRVFYSSTVQRFKEILAESSFSVGFIAPVYDTFIPLSVIISEGLRVNFLFTPVENTQQVLCLAMKRGMVYPAYQWVITSNTFDEVAVNVTFTYDYQQYHCSEADMITVALKEAIFFNYRLSPLNETSPSTYSTYSFREYDQLFQERIAEYNSQSPKSNISYTVWSTYFYDSLWAWTVVLDRVTKQNTSLDLTELNYGNTAMSEMILEEFYRLDFEGVSGRVKFSNETGFLTRTVSVFQVNGSGTELVAYYNGTTFVKLIDHNRIPDNFADQISSIPVALAVVFFIIAFIQLVILIILHVLTIKWRLQHTVKASSVKLNQLMYIGCYLFLFTLLLHTIRGLRKFDSFTTVFLCNLTWAWLLPISFTLTFGTVAVRTWRLYRIFTHYLNPGRFIGDYYLMAFVFILLLIDIGVGTVWMSVDPQTLQYTNYSISNGVAVFQTSVRSCASQNLFVSLIPVFGLRVTLIIVVLVLAFLTRNIGNQSFTTKTLRILVYFFSAVMVIGFICFYITLFNSPDPTHSYVSIIITFNLMNFLFLTLVCLPPLLPILREKLYKRFPMLDKETVQALSDLDTLPAEGTSKFYI